MNLEKEFDKILQEFSKKTFEATQNALKEVTQDMLLRFAQASPIGTSVINYKSKWNYKSYHNVNYIYNEKVNQKGIPLSNLLEYSSKGRPHIRSTWDSNKADIQRKFIAIMQRKI